MSDLLAKAKRESEDAILWRQAHAAGRAEALGDVIRMIQNGWWKSDWEEALVAAVRALKDKP